MIDKALAKLGVFFAEQPHASQENSLWAQFMDDVAKPARWHGATTKLSNFSSLLFRKFHFAFARLERALRANSLKS